LERRDGLSILGWRVLRALGGGTVHQPSQGELLASKFRSKPARAKMHAYIAGPLFNEGERFWNGEINSRVAKAAFTTYIPQRDGTKLAHKSDVHKIYEEDKKAITEADLIVANLDGMDVDAGTAWNWATRTV
jgi:hypothetical protein